jgi:DNA-binding NarL/FixJ family response regulator
MTVRIVLIDDHPLVVGGIKAALLRQPSIVVVGQASSVAEARSVLASTPCDVVLLDLRLPDGSGIELLQERQDLLGPAFLVLSSFLTEEYGSAAIALGASGFLLKTSPIDDLIAAIEQVADGGLAFTADQLRASRRAVWAPLTEREHDLLRGVVAGRSNDELAGDLGVSRKTIEAYLSRLFARFGVVTRTELAVHVDHEQLLDLPTTPRRRANS